MYRAPPSGITPPAPGLEREEPEFKTEDDIPMDDGPSAREERARRADERSGREPGAPEERPLRKIERE